MRALIFALGFLIVASISSCDESSIYAEDSSDEFLEAEAYISKSKQHIDSIYNNIPAYADLKATKCPAGCFDGNKFDEQNPLMVFDPHELNVEEPWNSDFRNTKSAGSWMGFDEPYFNWNSIDPEHEMTMFDFVEKIKPFAALRYICVFVEDTAKFKLPKLDSTASEYTPGAGIGYAVMMDNTTAKVVCVFEVNVTNSPEVNYETYADSALIRKNELAQMDAVFAVRYDLYDNIRKDVQQQIEESN